MPENILTKCWRICCCGGSRCCGGRSGYGSPARNVDTVAVNGQNGFGFCHHAPAGQCPVCNTGTGPRSYRCGPHEPETAPGPWLAKYWGPWGGQGPWHLQR